MARRPTRREPTASTSTETGPAGERRRRVLVLQGGGALGSYQAGVFEALQANGHAPDWIAGISIGAINAAIICGNPPDRRIERLRTFWERITAPTAHFDVLPAELRHLVEGHIGTWRALSLGQPGFFRPRPPTEWLAGSTPSSYYDIAPLRETLEELVDFDLLNDNGMRLSIGATRVDTGAMVYFDTAHMRLGPEHIMASGALPPGFPPVEIDGVAYWDGGLVSNTPLQYVLSQTPRHDSLIFQVDLFPAEGDPPKTLDQTSERAKDIRYASHSLSATASERERHNLRRLAAELLDRLPADLADDPLIDKLREVACPTRMDVMHLVYRPEQPIGAQKDYQFDRFSAKIRWDKGVADARRAVDRAPWKEPPESGVGLRSFDFVGDEAPQAA